MSETSTLIGYSGRTIGREELALVPTPAATETHRPVPHHEIVQAHRINPAKRGKLCKKFRVLPGMGADVEHDRVRPYQGPQQRHQRAVMLLERGLEQMGEEARRDPAAIRARGKTAGLGVHAIAFLSRASSRSRKALVLRKGVLSLMRMARSLVISPASTASMHTFSKVSAKRTTSGVLSKVPR